MMMMTATQVTEKFAKKGMYFDKLFKSRKHPGCYIARKGYFYKHGKTAEGMVEQMVEKWPEIEIVQVRDEFNAWPKDSYFEVVFKIS
jgi:ABC-type sulfate transport system substrate-binding protein